MHTVDPNLLAGKPKGQKAWFRIPVIPHHHTPHDNKLYGVTTVGCPLFSFLPFYITTWIQW